MGGWSGLCSDRCLPANTNLIERQSEAKIMSTVENSSSLPISEAVGFSCHPGHLRTARGAQPVSPKN